MTMFGACSPKSKFRSFWTLSDLTQKRDWAAFVAAELEANGTFFGLGGGLANSLPAFMREHPGAVLESLQGPRITGYDVRKVEE
jgi:hypothetical protein